MPKDVHIAEDGTITVDGVVVTPAELAKEGPVVDRVWRELSNKANWNMKTAEKGILYLAGIAAATNGFGQIPMPASARGIITAAAAFALAAIHISTPKAN